MSTEDEVRASMAWGSAMLIVAIMAAAYGLSRAEACDRVELGAAVHHFDRDKDYNERGPALGCGVDRTEIRYFRNSYGWDTYSVARAVPLLGYLDLELGVMHGYRDKQPNIGGVSLWIAPRLTVPIAHNTEARLFLLGGSALAMTLVIRL